MRNYSLLFLFLFPLLPQLTFAQDQPAAAIKSPRIVANGDAVITLNGYCEDLPATDENCKTVITRTQFEQLSTALQPGMPLAQLLKVANAYAKNLRMAAVAEQRGIDKTEAFQQQMHYARLQLLAQDLNQELQAEAQQISSDDIDTFYHQHQADFEVAEFERIFVPDHGNSDAVSADTMMQFAGQIRSRLMNGEDSGKLQREVFEKAGLPVSTGSTSIKKVRIDSLPPNHISVMLLQPGQVAAIISDPGGAHFIYKMVEKKSPTLAESKDEIVERIATQRYRDSVKEFQGQTAFNDDYFNPDQGKSSKAQRHGKGTATAAQDVVTGLTSSSK